MPERGFDSGFWGDKWVRSNLPYGRYLFIYLWTNDHCNQAGVYEITLETMSFETGLPEAELLGLLNSMTAKVKWLPDHDIIWVKNFIKRQSKSPKFLIGAAKCLKKIKDNDLVAEVLEYNLINYSISIPYQYNIDSVCIPPDLSCSVSRSVNKEGIEVVKEEGKQLPRSRLEAEETLYEGDQKIISTWCSVKGFYMIPADASALVARLRTEFSDMDILAESKAWAARKISEPLLQSSRPSQQIWNWLRLARKYAQERSKREQDKGQRSKARPREAFSGGKW